MAQTGPGQGRNGAVMSYTVEEIMWRRDEDSLSYQEDVLSYSQTEYAQKTRGSWMSINGISPSREVEWSLRPARSGGVGDVARIAITKQPTPETTYGVRCIPERKHRYRHHFCIAHSLPTLARQAVRASESKWAHAGQRPLNVWHEEADQGEILWEESTNLRRRS
jgi:hypothetical protein